MNGTSPTTNSPESPLRFRLARVGDAGDIAKVHIACGDTQPDSFMPKLGAAFLREYYRLLLQEKHVVAICAVDGGGRIVGVVAGTLDASENMETMRKHRLRLGLYALRQMILHPGLIGGVLLRYRSTRQQQDNGKKYFITSGPRCAYWGMMPQARGGFGAIILFQKWLALMRILGAGDVFFEVDKSNETSIKSHFLLGAVVEQEFVTPDGKVRLIMRYPAPESGDPS